MKIIHCFRSPVGGIFRHVRDLLDQQIKAGHSVGFICDSSTGGEYEDRLFEKIEPDLELGLHRIPMARSIAPRDLFSLYSVSRLIRRLDPDIVHSHSAKGGVFGRLGARLASNKSRKIKTFYCPHGGAMHYDAASIKGKVFFFAERFLERFTNSLIFVSEYERDAYHHKVGIPGCQESIVYNGLREEEFKPVAASGGAASFLYIGMMRDLKGPDTFLEAVHILQQKTGENITAMFVGDGEDKPKYLSQIDALGLKGDVTVSAAMPAREAFSKADIVVVPSRAESLPYLVLEAIAAQKPIVCTDVGGIHEIFGAQKGRLVHAGNPEKLADGMLEMYMNANRQKEAAIFAEELKKRFSVHEMASSIQKIYQNH